MFNSTLFETLKLQFHSFPLSGHAPPRSLASLLDILQSPLTAHPFPITRLKSPPRTNKSRVMYFFTGSHFPSPNMKYLGSMYICTEPHKFSVPISFAILSPFCFKLDSASLYCDPTSPHPEKHSSIAYAPQLPLHRGVASPATLPKLMSTDSHLHLRMASLETLLTQTSYASESKSSTGPEKTCEGSNNFESLNATHRGGHLQWMYVSASLAALLCMALR
ncbi:hypothetical protein BDZ45DRAFT_676105 [Acephala macrosclerotiorum]|nr:hypothetical protein BDZ45DRAFT_676105 [Acephala macrosclerotiorum]